MQETLAHANPALTNAHGTLEGEKQHIELPAKRCLVGGLNPSEKYECGSWEYDIPNIWKVIKFHGSSHHQSENPYVC
jgi:hypothetical protein